MRRLCSDEYVYVADELINQSINQSINHSIYCYMAARRFIRISLVVYVLAVERECRVCTYVLAEDCKLQFSLCCTCNDVSTGRAWAEPGIIAGLNLRSLDWKQRFRHD